MHFQGRTIGGEADGNIFIYHILIMFLPFYYMWVPNSDTKVYIERECMSTIYMQEIVYNICRLPKYLFVSLQARSTLTSVVALKRGK